VGINFGEIGKFR